LPSTECGEFDFVVTRGMTAAPPLGFEHQQWVNLQIGTGPEFGRPKTLDVVLPQSTLVVTNVQAFPWNRLSVDGSLIDPNQLVAVRSFNYLESPHAEFAAVPLTAGQHHLTYEFEPPLLWLSLNLVSWAALGVWVFAWLAVLIVSIWQKPVLQRIDFASQSGGTSAPQSPGIGR
ncbi:MAG: hypothetical protein JO308_04950, partial [Verrucomicrobia bacterium]|nr:hypothetical protein [Verrucomicrobiota bacterium]